ncbi:hypothetical protein PMAYCL1PPCAC_10594, partial [Pristionchus mayeri]
MHLLLPTVLLLVLVSPSASQCTKNGDSTSCASWVKNGYCTNTAYSMDMRKLYCGVSCGFCNKDARQLLLVEPLTRQPASMPTQ